MPGFSGVPVDRSLVFCVMFCRSLFDVLSIFAWSLDCLSIILRFTAYDYHLYIFNLFLYDIPSYYNYNLSSIQRKITPDWIRYKKDCNKQKPWSKFIKTVFQKISTPCSKVFWQLCTDDVKWYRLHPFLKTQNINTGSLLIWQKARLALSF
jgi:hypothetical protein